MAMEDFQESGQTLLSHEERIETLTVCSEQTLFAGRGKGAKLLQPSTRVKNTSYRAVIKLI